MRAHVIRDGELPQPSVNIILVDALDFIPRLVDADLYGGAIGDLWDGQTFTKPEPVVVVPQVVTRRQAKQALLLATDGLGTTLLSKVQPAIDAIQDPTQRALIQIEWDESLDFERTRPSLIAMGTAIGLNAAGIDALFIAAATL
jgi:hypothetical protein